MKILLLTLVLVVTGCSAAHHFSAKKERLDRWQAVLQIADLTEQEKDLAYLNEVEREFPEYFEEIHYLKKRVRTIHTKIKQGENANEDKEDFNIAVKKFWQTVHTDANQRDSAALDALIDMNEEMAQRRRPLNCSTQVIGSTGYTNCY